MINGVKKWSHVPIRPIRNLAQSLSALRRTVYPVTRNIYGWSTPLNRAPCPLYHIGFPADFIDSDDRWRKILREQINHCLPIGKKHIPSVVDLDISVKNFVCFRFFLKRKYLPLFSHHLRECDRLGANAGSDFNDGVADVNKSSK